MITPSKIELSLLSSLPVFLQSTEAFLTRVVFRDFLYAKKAGRPETSERPAFMQLPSDCLSTFP